MAVDLTPRRMGRPPSCVCGECAKCKHAAYMRTYYASKSPSERRRLFVEGRDPERVLLHNRIITPARRETRRRSKLRHPDRHSARARVYWAVMTGQLVRLPCYHCGCERVEAHHPDYSKALDVIWTCRQHHAALHGKPAI